MKSCRSKRDWFTMPRRFIQYNDLVFDGTESIRSAPSETVTTKYYSTDYLLKDGSYVATGEQLLLKESRLTLDLEIATVGWDLDTVKAHVDFIREQLVKRGKLWAIDTGGTIIWADAILTSYTPTHEWKRNDKGYIIFQIEFFIPSGKWNKADGKTTFLVEYSLCSFTQTLANCFTNTDCPNCEDRALFDETHCNDCQKACCGIGSAIPLCDAEEFYQDELFEKCGSGWRIIHNCELGRDKYGEEALWGQQICDMCTNEVFSAQFYADTALDTSDITITLEGEFKDPEININDTHVRLEGEFNDGYLRISSNGKVSTFSNPVSSDCNVKKVSNQGLTLCEHKFWTIHRGVNQITVRGVKSEQLCVFIKYERTTI